MKVKAKQTQVKYTPEERYEMYVERKVDQHRAYRNKKRYSKADRRKNKIRIY